MPDTSASPIKEKASRFLSDKNNVQLACYFILGILVISFAYRGWAYDDPFITYRYARNISQGLGFVYNPGERILSTTTPLFTLLLSFFHLFIQDIHPIANLIGAISLFAGGYFLYDLSRSWKSPLVGWAGLFLYPTFPLLVSTLGSETTLSLALCLGSFSFYARKKYLVTAIFAALACLARPDAVLVPLILAVHYLVQRPVQIPWKSIIVFSGILSIWVVFSWVYFGSPLPATLFVKQQQGAMAISQKFAEGFITTIQGYINARYSLMLALGIAGIIYAFWKPNRWLFFLSWNLAYFAAYTFLGVSRYFWYYAPLVPGIVVLVGLGITAAFDLVIRAGKYLSRTPAKLAQVVSFVLILLLVLVNLSSLWAMQSQADNRFAAYKATGEWLEQNTPPGSEVGLLEAGIIGYYSQRVIIDFAGLIHPEVAEVFGVDTTYEDAALWTIENYDLDYVVLHADLFSRVEGQLGDNNCARVQRINGKKFDYSMDLVIYSCGVN